MKLRKQTGLFLLLGCLVMGGGTLAAQGKAPESTLRPTRFKFSESLRKEIMTKVDLNSKETRFASGGQLNLEFELPLTSGEGGEFGPSTPFVVKAGKFEFRSTLEKDPDFHAGADSATLKLTSATESDKSRIILAKASLHWDKKKLTVKIDAKTPAVNNIAAEDFLGNLRGDIEGETKVAIEFGSYRAETLVPFRGKLNHIVRESFDVTGEVITVNLRGDLKKP